ncbi:MAG: glycosyltransferase family 4 protein [Acidobacteriota bacterium]|nr:glycosyltransferase family 4 protein [Acidobacteriota bacterium]
MKVLWLNANLLLPLDKGGKLRTWHVMRHLAARHEITYLSFCDPGQPAADHEGMSAVCADLHTVARTDPAKGTARFYLDAARYLVDSVPYGVAKYRSPTFRNMLAGLLEQRRFDAIVCDFLVPIVNLPAQLPCPALLFTHNVEAEIWRRHAEHATNPLSRYLLRQQWRRMLRFERDALARFDLALAVSEIDRDTFQRLYPDALQTPAHVVQTGVDTTYFVPSAAPVRRAHLVFTGSMDWLPNEDGMQYFVRDILPRIRQVEPDATLSIIGRAPTPAVTRLALDAGIEVTGRVDDVRPHIAAGAVYVVPLRIGGGTRLKIFEAMSMGKAVVSTTVGAEGLPVTPGRNILLADEPARFAQAVVHMIRDVDARRSLEIEARRIVVERYDWSAVAEDFEDALERVVAGGNARPARNAGLERTA